MRSQPAQILNYVRTSAECASHPDAALLERSPGAAVALLADKFRPAGVAANAEIDTLINDLDSEVFATREEASLKLRDQARKAEPALRRRLDDRPSLETKRRIEAVLATIGLPPLRLPVSGDTLRGVRAIEVLERVGTAKARQQLAAWAGQMAELHLTVEARTALERLGPPTDNAPASGK